MASASSVLVPCSTCANTGQFASSAWPSRAPTNERNTKPTATSCRFIFRLLRFRRRMQYGTRARDNFRLSPVAELSASGEREPVYLPAFGCPDDRRTTIDKRGELP